MKHYYKNLLMLPVVFVLFFSANNSMWPNSNRLSNTDKSTCVQFQLLKGSNRVAEYNKIISIIHSNDVVNGACSQEDIKKIFGTPDEVVSNKYVYYLNPNVANSKVEISFSEKHIVTNYILFGR